MTGGSSGLSFDAMGMKDLHRDLLAGCPPRPQTPAGSAPAIPRAEEAAEGRTAHHRETLRWPALGAARPPRRWWSS